VQANRAKGQHDPFGQHDLDGLGFAVNFAFIILCWLVVGFLVFMIKLQRWLAWRRHRNPTQLLLRLAALRRPCEVASVRMSSKIVSVGIFITLRTSRAARSAWTRLPDNWQPLCAVADAAVTRFVGGRIEIGRRAVTAISRRRSRGAGHRTGVVECALQCCCVGGHDLVVCGWFEQGGVPPIRKQCCPLGISRTPRARSDWQGLRVFRYKAERHEVAVSARAEST
jgi:hypothetical protein